MERGARLAVLSFPTCPGCWDSHFEPPLPLCTLVVQRLREVSKCTQDSPVGPHNCLDLSGQERWVLTEMLTDRGYRLAQAIPRAYLAEVKLSVHVDLAPLHGILPSHNSPPGGIV